jgi:hypothetical protein
MQFIGIVEKQLVKILLDTGASGTALMHLQYCKDENIPLYPAPQGMPVSVLGCITGVYLLLLYLLLINLGGLDDFSDDKDGAL